MNLTQTYAAVIGKSHEAAEIGPAESRNGLIHLLALILTKTGDGLVDPKLVLTWVLQTLGAPAAFIGALVPLREALALLPQALLSLRVQAARRRRLFWSAGSAIQGLSALGMAVSVATLEGAAAGWAIVSLLAVFSLARSMCSVSYKDVLARTLPKTRRGSITGAAASIAALLVFIFAASLAARLLPLSVATIAWAIAAGSIGWLIASVFFTRLEETPEPGSEREPNNRILQPLLEDRHLQRFILTRALLVSTALAPPFLILASGAGNSSSVGHLGILMIASAAASVASSWAWGRLSDRSSRRTLALSAGLAALVLGTSSGIVFATGGLFGTLGTGAAIFAIQVAYEGVRAGRKLHLTDMADDRSRARYTAASNTIIGAVLILGGTLGFLNDITGVGGVLVLLASLSALAIPIALTLQEVQTP